MNERKGGTSPKGMGKALEHGLHFPLSSLYGNLHHAPSRRGYIIFVFLSSPCAQTVRVFR